MILISLQATTKADQSSYCYSNELHEAASSPSLKLTCQAWFHFCSTFHLITDLDLNFFMKCVLPYHSIPQIHGGFGYTIQYPCRDELWVQLCITSIMHFVYQTISYYSMYYCENCQLWTKSTSNLAPKHDLGISSCLLYYHQIYQLNSILHMHYCHSGDFVWSFLINYYCS